MHGPTNVEVYFNFTAEIALAIIKRRGQRCRYSLQRTSAPTWNNLSYKFSLSLFLLLILQFVILLKKSPLKSN